MEEFGVGGDLANLSGVRQREGEDVLASPGEPDRSRRRPAGRTGGDVADFGGLRLREDQHVFAVPVIPHRARLRSTSVVDAREPQNLFPLELAQGLAAQSALEIHRPPHVPGELGFYDESGLAHSRTGATGGDTIRESRCSPHFNACVNHFMESGSPVTGPSPAPGSAAAGLTATAADPTCWAAGERP